MWAVSGRGAVGHACEKLQTDEIKKEREEISMQRLGWMFEKEVYESTRPGKEAELECLKSAMGI